MSNTSLCDAAHEMKAKCLKTDKSLKILMPAGLNGHSKLKLMAPTSHTMCLQLASHHVGQLINLNTQLDEVG